MVPRLLEKYRSQVIPLMMKKFDYKSTMEVPRLVKIVINMGVGEAAADIKILESAASNLATVAGQKPIITRARKAIANFKIRKDSPIGCKVTLRRTYMYEFLDRLICTAMPRIKDFKGLPLRSFDGNGNYTFGLTEQLVFPEVDYDKVTKVQGMDITVVTNAKSRPDALELLRQLGMPFREK